MRTTITRESLLSIWVETLRRVPDSVMLTTAQMESGIGKGLYDLSVERYEESAHNRKGGTREGWTSYGVFQILGMNDNTLAPAHAAFLRSEKLAQDCDRYLRIQCEAYDKFMSKLIIKYGLPKAFKRYNGSGPMSDRYLEKAVIIWEEKKQFYK